MSTPAPTFEPFCGATLAFLENVIAASLVGPSFMYEISKTEREADTYGVATTSRIFATNKRAEAPDSGGGSGDDSETDEVRFFVVSYSGRDQRDFPAPYPIDGTCIRYGLRIGNATNYGYYLRKDQPIEDHVAAVNKLVTSCIEDAVEEEDNAKYNYARAKRGLRTIRAAFPALVEPTMGDDASSGDK